MYGHSQKVHVVTAPKGPTDSDMTAYMKDELRGIQSPRHRKGIQEHTGDSEEHFVFKSHKWPFNNKAVVLPSSQFWVQRHYPRQLAHQERGHCVLLSVIYVAGRSPAMFPVIMTLRGNVESLFFSCTAGMGCRAEPLGHTSSSRGL